jgi:hypothetical protein
MANHIRFQAVYYNSKKVGSVNQSSVKINGNDTRQYGAEGVFGMAEGVIDVDVDATMVFPVEGIGITLLDDLLNKKDVTLAFLMGTQLFSSTFRTINATVDSQSKSGETTVKGTWQNVDVPKLVG